MRHGTWNGEWLTRWLGSYARAGQRSVSTARLKDIEGRVDTMGPESPPEKALLMAFLALEEDGLHVTAQERIGRYRVDVLLRRGDAYLCVEVDGWRSHRSRERMKKDRKRDRVLRATGYPVVRFTGSEVWEDAFGCAMEAMGLVGGDAL